MGDLLQFIPRPNPKRDASAIEIKNVRKIKTDDPNAFAMDDDTAPPESGSSGEDGA